jgi:hypothetical protein
VRTPNPHAEAGSGLTGVACPAATACEAAGSYAYADVQEAARPQNDEHG